MGVLQVTVGRVLLLTEKPKTHNQSDESEPNCSEKSRYDRKNFKYFVLI